MANLLRLATLAVAPGGDNDGYSLLAPRGCVVLGVVLGRDTVLSALFACFNTWAQVFALALPICSPKALASVTGIPLLTASTVAGRVVSALTLLTSFICLFVNLFFGRV